MGYYVRVLLERWEDRPPIDLLAFSRRYGHELRLDRSAETEVEDPPTPGGRLCRDHGKREAPPLGGASSFWGANHRVMSLLRPRGCASVRPRELHVPIEDRLADVDAGARCRRQRQW